MDWNEATNKYHKFTFAHGCKLSSLASDWQRELAALCRLNADVNSGSYVQFLVNWGKESYVYACQGLKKIGARRMFEIVANCQMLVDEHFDFEAASPAERRQLMPNPTIRLDGTRTEAHASILPANVLARIDDLSREFIGYSDDLATLGWSCYRSHIEHDNAGPADRSA